MAVTRQDVTDAVLSLLGKLAEDWDHDDEIGTETWLVQDLAMESIDVVVLGTTIQEHFQANLPFAEYLADVGQRDVKDIQVDELIGFVHQHVADAA